MRSGADDDGNRRHRHSAGGGTLRRAGRGLFDHQIAALTATAIGALTDTGVAALSTSQLKALTMPRSPAQRRPDRRAVDGSAAVADSKQVAALTTLASAG